MDFIFDDFVQITEIKTFELKLKFGSGIRGRVHITEVTLLCFLVSKMSRLMFCCFAALHV
jgi:hypothetical protein